MDATAIQDFRTSKQLTQNQLAELIGVSPTAVTTWERGQLPSGSALKLLNFLIYGIHPFHGVAGAGEAWDLPLNLSEWESLEQRRVRNGFASIRDYIIWLVRNSPEGIKAPVPAAPRAATQAASRAKRTTNRPAKTQPHTTPTATSPQPALQPKAKKKASAKNGSRSDS